MIAITKPCMSACLPLNTPWSEARGSFLHHIFIWGMSFGAKE